MKEKSASGLPPVQLDSGLITLTNNVSNVQLRAPADWQQVIGPRSHGQEYQSLVSVMVEKPGSETLHSHPGPIKCQRLDSVHRYRCACGKVARNLLRLLDSAVMGVQDAAHKAHTAATTMANEYGRRP